MKKLIAAIAALLLTLTCFFPVMAESGKINVVTTIFPIYDWVKEIAGDHDNVEITLLLDSGVDLHSYQPTVQDIVKVSTSDVFIYVGGESDEWVDGALAEAVNPNMKVVNLVEAMGEDIKAEEIVEGMEHEHEHEEEHSDAHEKEVSTFEDDQVQDRSLSDWTGDWQSAYPYVMDGTLDEGFEHKAESGKMTAEEYKAYYAKGYESDIAKIKIDGETNIIEYTDVNGNSCKSEYKYLGYYIQDWSTGTRAAMYRFEAVDKESGAPIFIEFNDHIIEPVKAEHFHFRASNESFDAIEDPENRWPTFYPASFDADEMLDAFIGHDHEEEHEHEEIKAEDIKDRTLAEFNGEWKSLLPLAQSGELDAFFEHEAEEEGSTAEEAKAEYLEKWACDAVTIKVEDDTISFTTADGTACSAVYTYAGYAPVLAEDGDISAVRYQFTTDSADAPKYVQFNDHGHEPGEVEHFHVYFGNDSFEALLKAESNPFFVPADQSAAGIMSELTEHDHDHHDHDHEHEEEEKDEHVWLSLRNAQKLVAAITEALCEADPADAESFKSNAAAYIEKLVALDAQYKEVVDAAAYKTVLFGDRFPFRYLVDDYGLAYYAAFSGCSAESEASFATIVFLAGKVDELKLPAVMTIENPHFRIAETIVENTQSKDQKILSLNSMQGTTADEISAGATYLGIMENNLTILRDALN